MNRSLLIESFQLTLKSHSFIPSYMKSTCTNFLSHGYEFNNTLQLVLKVGHRSLSRLKWPISSYLEVCLEKFFDSFM